VSTGRSNQRILNSRPCGFEKFLDERIRPEVQFNDKVLPDQREHAYVYKGASFVRDPFTVVCSSSGIRNPHDEFKIEQSDMFTAEEVASNPVAMLFCNS
jgi:hypothetical protein